MRQLAHLASVLLTASAIASTPSVPPVGKFRRCDEFQPPTFQGSTTPCVKDASPSRDCTRTLVLGIRVVDPACEAELAVARAMVEERYRDCLARREQAIVVSAATGLCASQRAKEIEAAAMLTTVFQRTVAGISPSGLRIHTLPRRVRDDLAETVDNAVLSSATYTTDMLAITMEPWFPATAYEVLATNGALAIGTTVLINPDRVGDSLAWRFALKMMEQGQKLGWDGVAQVLLFAPDYLTSVCVPEVRTVRCDSLTIRVGCLQITHPYLKLSLTATNDGITESSFGFGKAVRRGNLGFLHGDGTKLWGEKSVLTGGDQRPRETLIAPKSTVRMEVYFPHSSNTSRRTYTWWTGDADCTFKDLEVCRQ